MRYDEYLRTFLQLEQQLCDLMGELPYESGTENVNSSRMNLILLSTCPVVESYIKQTAVRSPAVHAHALWTWEYAWRIWDHEGRANDRRLKYTTSNERILSGNFPKFAYVAEEVFSVSSRTIQLYRYNSVKHVPGFADAIEILQPFESVESFKSFHDYDGTGNFPRGYNTPQWWDAYNKIKHEMDLSGGKATYSAVVNALAAFFLCLAYCNPDMMVLNANGFVRQEGMASSMETRVFRAVL